jgi:hypothetical protein
MYMVVDGSGESGSIIDSLCIICSVLVDLLSQWPVAPLSAPLSCHSIKMPSFLWR